LNRLYVENVVSPELQIANENTTINTINLLKKGIVDNTGFVNLSGGSTDVRLNMLNEQTLTLSSTGDNLVAYLNKIMMAGQMPTNMQGRSRRIIRASQRRAQRQTPMPRSGARGLIYLIAASPQFAVQK